MNPVNATLKVTRGEFNRCDEIHNMEKVCNKMESSQREFLNENITLTKRVNAIERDFNHKLKILDQHAQGLSGSITKIEVEAG